MATKIIGTGGDYSTIASWESSLPATLTEVEVGKCKAENFRENVSISGTTTSATNYIELTSEVGAEHDGRANAVSLAGNARIDSGTSSDESIDILDEHVRTCWLEHYNAGGGASAATAGIRIRAVLAGSEVWVYNNIVHNDRAATSLANYGISSEDTDCTLKAFRNIVYGMGGAGVRATACSSSSLVYNNTLYKNNASNNSTLGGIWGSAAGVTYKNNASFDNTKQDYNISNGTTAKNASSDATGNAPHTNLATNSQFRKPTTVWTETDLRIKSRADIENIGENLGSPYDVAITNRKLTVSVPWDAGADEFGAAGYDSLLRSDKLSNVLISGGLALGNVS